ncbi:uncharacterized protein LOC111010169 [Momordica charantia]|uniref:Uncharacterized protein LOC111010169 n=1 Tax=Momordica charantia TaxID=3673 RepID=A0A6J1CBN0_MOMCH|nr:uncharacterized protein LOC111010169 [Momordica charantia]
MTTQPQTEAKAQTQSETESKVSLKLVIDQKEKRILYAEADKKFIDFLFTILSLPLGAVVKLLSTGVPLETWSIVNVYRTHQTLNLNYFASTRNKDILLNPNLPSATPSDELQSLLQIQSFHPPTTYYTCHVSTYNVCRYSFSGTYGAVCSRCGQSMTTNATYVYGAKEAKPLEMGGYVKGGMVTFMVMDDLTVKPISSSMSTISVLHQLHVEDVGQIEEKLIYLDINEGVKLLRASLCTSTVLTDVFLHKIDFPTTPGDQ